MCQVMCGGSFPSDYIHIYDTDSARDSLLLEGGRASLKPLLPVGRCGQGGAHMQVKAMLLAEEHERNAMHAEDTRIAERSQKITKATEV